MTRKQKAVIATAAVVLAVGVAVWIQVATGSPAVTAVAFVLAGLFGSYFGWQWSRKKSVEVEGYRQDLIGKRKVEDLHPDGREDLED
jgi:membrane protein implicated in regulation of membrane protease activity